LGDICCSELKVSWKDDEGDWIRMSSDEEWSEALHFYKTNNLTALHLKVDSCSHSSPTTTDAHTQSTKKGSGSSDSSSSWKRISLPLTSLKSHYSVIVIGSGYGASILANRLSRANQVNLRVILFNSLSKCAF
jgi:hypothetical protein